MSKLFRDSESLGKSSERNGLRFEHFCSKIAAAKKVFYRVKNKWLTFEVLFKHLFALTSRNRMSKIFRDLESLGEYNGKKVVSDVNIFAHKVSKIAAKFFFYR